MYREALLRGAAVLWRGCDTLVGSEAEGDRLWANLLGHAALHPQPTFVDHAQAVGPAHAPPRRGRVPPGDLPVTSGLGERREIWARLPHGQRLGSRRDRCRRGCRSPGR